MIPVYFRKLPSMDHFETLMNSFLLGFLHLIYIQTVIQVIRRKVFIKNLFKDFLLCYLLFYCVATWVGGAFIVGIVEMVYTPSMGLIRTLILLMGYSSSFIIGKTKTLQKTQNKPF